MIIDNDSLPNLVLLSGWDVRNVVNTDLICDNSTIDIEHNIIIIRSRLSHRRVPIPIKYIIDIENKKFTYETPEEIYIVMHIMKRHDCKGLNFGTINYISNGYYILPCADFDVLLIPGKSTIIHPIERNVDINCHRSHELHVIEYGKSNRYLKTKSARNNFLEKS